MGIFLLLLTLALEVAGMVWSYWFGVHAFGIGQAWAGWINGLPAFFPGLRHYHIHVTAAHIGLVWLAANLFLHGVAIWVSIRKVGGERAKLGRPGLREIEAVNRVFQALVTATAPATGGLEPVTHFHWPRSFNYAPGHGVEVRFIGFRLVIDEGLFTNQYLKPLLAQQLGYYNSRDLWIRNMLGCLPPPALVLLVITGIGIGIGPFVTFFFWPWYWRQRVYAHDLFAARLGQANQLIQALDRLVRPRERRKSIFIREYPYAAERIDRLMRYRGTEEPLTSTQRRRQRS